MSDAVVLLKEMFPSHSFLGPILKRDNDKIFTGACYHLAIDNKHFYLYEPLPLDNAKSIMAVHKKMQELKSVCVFDLTDSVAIKRNAVCMLASLKLNIIFSANFIAVPDLHELVKAKKSGT